MSTPKLHNKPLSIDHRPSNGASAQEAADPSPGPDLAPDARGPAPRKNPRGPASPDALLQAPDACGNLPQKKTRTPAPVRQERSRRGRPYPQNRDGSGKAGQAEGSLPRLAPEGRGFEQEIILLRSMINRLLSRRPLNHTYISRYMRLLIQAQSAQARAPKRAHRRAGSRLPHQEALLQEGGGRPTLLLRPPAHTHRPARREMVALETADVRGRTTPGRPHRP